jgi:hypothetical protein
LLHIKDGRLCFAGTPGLYARGKPGPDVARLKVASTGVAGDEEGIKPYQLIAAALVATLAYRWAEGTPVCFMTG